MKVYIRDKRANPRVIYIDGHKYYLGANKEYLNDISATAYKLLSQKEYIEMRPYEDAVKEEFVKELEKADLLNSEPAKEEAIKKPVRPSDEATEEDAAKVQEEAKAPVEVVEEPKNDAFDEPCSGDDSVEVKAEEKVEGTVEEKPDYSSMTKKVLKGIVEEKGGDPTGMTKANMIEWLEANA